MFKIHKNWFLGVLAPPEYESNFQIDLGNHPGRVMPDSSLTPVGDWPLPWGQMHPELTLKPWKALDRPKTIWNHPQLNFGYRLPARKKWKNYTGPDLSIFHDFWIYAFFTLYIPNNGSELNFDGRNAFSGKNNPRLPNLISFDAKFGEKNNPT